MAGSQITEFDTFGYLTFKELFKLIDDPLGAKLDELHYDWAALFKVSPGAKNNHHVWRGGYLDHVLDCMNIAVELYRLFQHRRPLNFSLSSALAVLYLHDIEKPFKYVRSQPDLGTKIQRRQFRHQFVLEWKIPLSLEEALALDHTEGENEEYSASKRVMSELAAFCHACDILSARVWFDFGISRLPPAH